MNHITNLRPWYARGLAPLLLTCYTVGATIGLLVHFYL